MNMLFIPFTHHVQRERAKKKKKNPILFIGSVIREALEWMENCYTINKFCRAHANVRCDSRNERHTTTTCSMNEKKKKHRFVCFIVLRG